MPKEKLGAPERVAPNESETAHERGQFHHPAIPSSNSGRIPESDVLTPARV
jgi:hypothetical protein